MKYGGMGGEDDTNSNKRIEFDEFLELFLDHSIEVEAIQIDPDVADEIRRLNKIDQEKKATIRREFRRTGGLYHHTLKDEEEYCWVLVFTNEEHEKHALDEFEKSEMRDKREAQLSSFLLAGMALKTYCSASSLSYYHIRTHNPRFCSPRYGSQNLLQC